MFISKWIFVRYVAFRNLIQFVENGLLPAVNVSNAAKTIVIYSYQLLKQLENVCIIIFNLVYNCWAAAVSTRKRIYFSNYSLKLFNIAVFTALFLFRFAGYFISYLLLTHDAELNTKFCHKDKNYLCENAIIIPSRAPSSQSNCPNLFCFQIDPVSFLINCSCFNHL